MTRRPPVTSSLQQQRLHAVKRLSPLRHHPAAARIFSLGGWGPCRAQVARGPRVLRRLVHPDGPRTFQVRVLDEHEQRRRLRHHELCRGARRRARTRFSIEGLWPDGSARGAFGAVTPARCARCVSIRYPRSRNAACFALASRWRSAARERTRSRDPCPVAVDFSRRASVRAAYGPVRCQPAVGSCV
jgi:hypothetical protein